METELACTNGRIFVSWHSFNNTSDWMTEELGSKTTPDSSEDWWRMCLIKETIDFGSVLIAWARLYRTHYKWARE